MTHGIYLYRGGARSQDPLYTGTKEQCKQRIDCLSPAQRLQGWTIAPLPFYCEEDQPLTRSQSVWALIGLALVTFVIVIAVLSLRGHIR